MAKHSVEGEGDFCYQLILQYMSVSLAFFGNALINKAHDFAVMFALMYFL